MPGAAPAQVLSPEVHEASALDLAELPLDALLNLEISGASRYPQRMSDAVASVTVIDADEIRALGARTLAEALQPVRGLMLATDRTYDFLGVRGFFSAGNYNTRVLLLIDGRRVNDALYDQAYLGDEFPLDLDEVERIEFIPGPGSAVHGANALFGVINVITRKATGPAGATLGLRLGSRSRREWRAAAQHSLGPGALRLSASRSRADGDSFFDASQANPAAPEGWARGVDASRRDALRARYDAGPLSLSLVHADRVKQVPLYPGLVFGDARSRYRDTQTLLDAEWRQALGGASSWTHRIWAGDYRFTGDYAIDYPPVTLNRDEGEGRWWGLESRWVSEAVAGHKWVLGGEMQQAPRLVQTNADVGSAPATYLNDHQRQARWSVYGEDQARLGASVNGTLGLRLDHLNGRTSQWSPRLGLAWRARDKLVAKLLYSAAFRAPNRYEAGYNVDGPGGYRRNPGLQAEHVKALELGLEWWPGSATRVVASLFRNHATDLVVLSYDAAADRYAFGNLGRMVSRGMEAELEQRWPGGARLRANLTWQTSRAEGAADPSVTSTSQAFPQAMGKLAWIWPLGGRWTLGVDGQALSWRGTVPGQVLANLALSTLRRPQGWGFSLAWRNVFDRTVVDPGFDPQRQPTVPLPGRRWLLSVDRSL